MNQWILRDPRIETARRAVDDVLAGAPPESLERRDLDFKEEVDRRAPSGDLKPGERTSDSAARAMAEAACCMANSIGGVLVIGIDDKGAGPDAVLGTELDAEWLRERVWELSEPHLAVEAVEVRDFGPRLLFVLVPQGHRLHRCAKKFKHRVGTQCVDMSAEDQRRAEESRVGYDWSAERSDASASDISEGAVERLREYLRTSGEESRAQLAARATPDLLRALGVLGSDGRLTNAGKLLLVPSERVLVDYQRRATPGASSTDRLESSAPLITAYAEIKARIDAVNEERQLQLPSGVRPRIRLVPDRAVREALVNALIHRDYRLADPVLVEFINTQLVISSPGGFPPGITSDNVISERSHPRNASLTGVFRSLRLAEREGVGVDRIFRDMVVGGHALPTLAEHGGRVRCVLTGGEPSSSVLALIASLPESAQDDVDLALILHALMERPTVEAAELTFALQKLQPEVEEALARGKELGLLADSPTSTRAKPRYRFADSARDQLRDRLPYLTTSSSEAEEFVVRHLVTQSSIKPRDVADMLSVTEVQGSRVLRELREAGVVAIGSKQSRGRGVFHIAGPRFDEARHRHGT